MSLSSSPEILSGPFGSLINDLHNVSTRDAFKEGHFEYIRNALTAYKLAGVTQPVTPTFGAAARGVDGGKFTSELRHWNQYAVQFTREVFQKEPYASIAPLLDTSGGDDAKWSGVSNRVGRARKIHTPQMHAVREAGVVNVLGEALHDYDEAAGFVAAAQEQGMHHAIVSFEPTTENGLPLNTHGISSYAEVLGRLQDSTRGRIDVSIGLNCGNGNQIIDLLRRERPNTFNAIYPNKAAIPSGPVGARFRELADLNDQRNNTENREFEILRETFELSAVQREQMVQLCLEKGVGHIGMCCGSSPHDVRGIAQQLTHSDVLQDSHVA